MKISGSDDKLHYRQHTGERRRTRTNHALRGDLADTISTVAAVGRVSELHAQDGHARRRRGARPKLQSRIICMDKIRAIQARIVYGRIG